MPRICTTILVLAVASATDHEPQLRSELAREAIADKKGKRDQANNNGHGTGGTFSVEKGIKCEGNWKQHDAINKKCEGGMKSEFTMEFNAEDMAKELADQLFDETNSFMPGVEAYYPDEEAMAALMEFDDDAAVEGMTEGHSKTIEFGGVVKAEFGCKVTFERNNGKFTKKSACGFKGSSRAGKKPDGADEETNPFGDFAEF
jgi:hypothetical protein